MIIDFGKACKLCGQLMEEDAERIGKMRGLLREHSQAEMPDVPLPEHPTKLLHNDFNVCGHHSAESVIRRANGLESIVTRVDVQCSVGPRGRADDGPMGQTDLGFNHVEGPVSANNSFAGGRERNGDETVDNSSGNSYCHGPFPCSRAPLIRPDL
ncbi:MAG: hypothetical protein IID46_09015 [Planctomycetes bacterium]|nr:hypothetical protein [Planctomycetota bacterium]